MRLPGSDSSPRGLGVCAGRPGLRTPRLRTFPARRPIRGDRGPLPLEELSFRLGPAFARVFTESAGFGDDAVAGDYDDGRVPGACRADGPRRARSTEPPGDLPVRDHLARRNCPTELQDLPLDRGHLDVQRA